jgi:hypothetical protein
MRDWPDEPLAALWQATTLLREHRGDVHITVLSAAGVTGRECNVLHADIVLETKAHVISRGL